MTAAVDWNGGSMAEQQPIRMVDGAYKPKRIEWMLENYHALLTRRVISAQEREILSGVVSVHSQWWNAQRYWEKVARKSDLEEGVEWATQSDYRKRVIIQYRYLNEPQDTMNWDEIAAMLALSRMHVWRIHRQIVADVSYYLGGSSDE